MAAQAGPVILPQFQGDYLDIQRKQALAQALMGMSLQNQGSALNQTGAGMRVMPSLSPLSGIAQLGTALLAARTGAQANQGMRDLGQQQMQFLMGSPGQQQPEPAPVAQQDAAPGSFGIGPGGGFTDGGVDAGTSTLASALAKARAPQATGGFLSPGGPNNPAGLPTQMAAQLYLSDPGEYWKTQAQQFKPADIVAQLRAAGIDPSSQLGQQIAQQSVAKANYIAPVSLRPGGYMFDPRTGQTQQMPHIPDGFTALQDPNGQWLVVPVEGATGAIAQSAAARTAGEGSMLPYDGVDAAGNPMPVTNRTAAATQAGATTPGQAAIVQTESNGNPNAVSPKGALGAWQVMPNTNANPGFGVTPARNNSPAELNRVGRDYYEAMSQRYGSPTLGAIAYNMGPGATDAWLKSGGSWEKLPQETRNYVGKVSTLTALNSGAGAAQGGQAPIYAKAPLGATNAANASQTAPSKQMADSQGALADSDSVYQQSREALTGMINLARNQGLGGTATRFVPEGVATRLSTDAAEYQKLHANYVSLQGKALGAAGSDASRATINESVPTYDKPQDAKVSGLTNQLNQLDLMHLKRQALSSLYQQGNEKAYAQQSATFDNVVKPSMMPTVMPIMQLSGDQQRAAVQQTVKANPALRPVFEMLFNNGMLK